MRIRGKNPVRLIVTLIGDGKALEKENRLVFVSEEELSPAEFVEKHVRNTIENDGISYAYLDCIKETFRIDGETRTVFYVRYNLDTEKEKFLTFLEDIKPSDFTKNIL